MVIIKNNGLRDSMISWGKDDSFHMLTRTEIDSKRRNFLRMDEKNILLTLMTSLIQRKDTIYTKIHVLSKCQVQNI